MARVTRRAVIAALLVVALATGCRVIYSVHPLFTDADLVLIPTLAGEWSDAAHPAGPRWAFVRPDTSGREYLLSIAPAALTHAFLRVDLGLLADDSVTKRRIRVDREARARRARDSVTVSRLACDRDGPRLFGAGVGRLAGSLFLDLTAETYGCGTRIGAPLLMPTHWFWRVALDNSRLTLVPLDPDWLGAMIDSGRVQVAHDTVGNTIVLTASTAELQAVISQHAEDATAFPAKNAVRLRRP